MYHSDSELQAVDLFLILDTDIKCEHLRDQSEMRGNSECSTPIRHERFHFNSSLT